MMGNNWNITPHRLEAFFASKERCRQNYGEAWGLGRAAYERLLKKCEEAESLRAKLAASQQRVAELEGGKDQAWVDHLEAANKDLAGKVKALREAMDKIHVKVMAEYPEVIYDIADKALALIDDTGKEEKKVGGDDER